MAEANSPFDFSNTNHEIPTANANNGNTSPGTQSQRPSARVLKVIDGPDESASQSPTIPHQTSLPTPPVADAQGRIFNPRSCVTCRKRKVKCDKLHPCSNCARANIECIFPNPGRAPRKIKKPTDGRDTELLARLKRLEGVVKGLGLDASQEDIESALADTTRRTSETDKRPGQINAPDSEPLERPSTNSDELSTRAKAQWIEDDRAGRFENRFGRLVINEGKSRYVNSSFWANLSNEVEDLKGILNDESDDDDDQSSPSGQMLQSAGSSQGWIFGFSSQMTNLLPLHPPSNQIKLYWTIYKERVDPLCKVLHVPTIEPTVLSAASHLGNLAKGFESLIFAIYYGAVTSLSAEECMSMLGEDRDALLARYRFAIEQALAHASFLTTEEIVVLQAFVIYMLCLRRNSYARMIWTLTGLIVRMAQTIGIHRDGTHFALSPFEVEMRRRLWWQICILDIRASEDHGCDPTIAEQQFDTLMPLNINDVDIDPSSKTMPKERQGCTDMSFCLIRFEVANTFRRLNYIPPGSHQVSGFSSVKLEDKEKWIAECQQRLEDKYLKHCDMSVPIFWVTATVARLMMAKMWLMVYHPFQRENGGANLPNEIREKLFITSLENIEYASLLETEARTMKWGWLFKTYMQWHALAFILSELCHRTQGELVERAWIAVDKTCDRHWHDRAFSEDHRKGHLWRPLNRIIGKARAARAQALAENARLENDIARPLPKDILPGSTADFVTAMRNRPRMVSAPLSQAQLNRFIESSPSYGTRPMDSTKLLQSPSLNSIDAASIPVDLSIESTAPGLVHGNTWPVRPENMTTSNSTASSRPLFAPQTPSELFLNRPTEATADVDMPFDVNGTADTDMDWASWDQLVAQFGMDVDSVPTGYGSNMPGTENGDPSATNNTTDDQGAWSRGGQWNYGNGFPGPGSGMGMGMGSGMTGGNWLG
ncbi:hypothetical protein MBLNU457_7635t2 [Dothideomycetes sp. NU457]